MMFACPTADEAEEEWDDWEDDESLGVRCLLSDATFATLEDALAHDCQQGFDLREYMRKVELLCFELLGAAALRACGSSILHCEFTLLPRMHCRRAWASMTSSR